MDRFNALGRGIQIMLVAGVLLIIDTFFDWQAIGDVPGVSAWDDVGGIIMSLLTIVLVVWIVARIVGTDIPLPVSPALTGAVLAALILILAVVKNLQDDFSTEWAWIGMLLAVAIAVGAFLEVQAAGGMNALMSELPAMGTSGSTAATTSAPEPPAAAAPAPPPPAETAPEPTPPPAPETAPEEPSARERPREEET